MSLASVFIGVTLVNALKPGSSLPPEKQVELRAQYAKAAEDAVKKSQAAKSIQQTMLDMLPENPLQEMVGAVDGSSKGNGMLAVMFFSLVVGVALTLTRERTGPFDRSDRRAVRCHDDHHRLCHAAGTLCVACLMFAITAP